MKPKLCSLLACCVLSGPGFVAARAAEPVSEFLAALRVEKYFDQSLVYLDDLRSSTLIDDATRERLGYEEGISLLAASAEPGDPQLRQKQLERAAAAFEKFAADHPAHPLLGSAKNQIAQIHVERARALLQNAGASDPAAQAAAREQYGQAHAQFAAAEEAINQRLAQMPRLIPPDQRELQAEKARLSGELAQARLMKANVDFETAQTFAPDSAEARARLEAARKAYGDLYQAYRTRTVGLLAHLWEGRCYQALGDVKLALGCYADLMDLPDAAETRSVRNKSIRQAMECWTSDQSKQYQAAIERGERWARESQATAAEVDTQAIRYLTAVAYQKQAAELPEQDPNRKRLTGSARSAVQEVARQPGEFQAPANMLLASLAGNTQAGEAKDSGTKKGKGKAAPKAARTSKFVEAITQAKTALEQMQQAANALEAARNGSDKAAIAKLQGEQDAAAGKARQLLLQALDARGEDATAELVNSARYYLCYLSWTQGNYYDAAVLGEYLARNFPDTLPGRQGAKIALASWVRLYGESKAEDRAFEIEQIQRIAKMTFKQWPDQQEAEEAALTLVNFAAAAGQVERAGEYLSKISETSPRRGQAELRAGQAIWSTYLKALREPADKRPAPERLEALRTEARELLEQGIARVQAAGTTDAVVATGVFSLAQLYLDGGDAAKAITWLEDPKVGPLTLVAAGSAAAASANLPIETYKLALRSYIAATPPQLEKAEAAMNSLEKLVQSSGDAKAQENLTAIYIGLGRQLQEDLKNLRESGKTEELAKLAAGFRLFLDRLHARSGTASLPTLNWMAETYLNLAEGFRGNAGQPSSEALASYEKAAASYKLLLAAAEKDPRFRDNPDGLLGLRLKMAAAYSGAGNFDEATLAVSQVLREKPSLLAAQVQGAQIYQARGATDPTGYVKAIMGGSPDKNGKNLIWGWSQLSRATMADEKFSEIFHQARLNIVESRYSYAMLEKDTAKREKLLLAGVEDVRSTANVRPDLGGPETRARYDAELKKLQKALGRPEIGLQEFRDSAKNTAAMK